MKSKFGSISSLYLTLLIENIAASLGFGGVFLLFIFIFKELLARDGAAVYLPDFAAYLRTSMAVAYILATVTRLILKRRPAYEKFLAKFQIHLFLALLFYIQLQPVLMDVVRIISVGIETRWLHLILIHAAALILSGMYFYAAASFAKASPSGIFRYTALYVAGLLVNFLLILLFHFSQVPSLNRIIYFAILVVSGLAVAWAVGKASLMYKKLEEKFPKSRYVAAPLLFVLVLFGLLLDVIFPTVQSDPKPVTVEYIDDTNEVLYKHGGLRLFNPRFQTYETTRLFNAGETQTVAPKQGDRLIFSYGTRSSLWDQENVQCEFNVFIKPEHKEEVNVFKDVLLPGRNTEDRGWRKGNISLSPYAGTSINIRFSSENLSVRDNERIQNAGAGGLWGGMRIGTFSRSADDYNIILISLDTLRGDRLGVSGYKKNTSPRIDQIARNGVYFEHGYSPAPWTYPAHVSLFTGLYPSAHRSGTKDALRAPISPRIKLMAEVLAEDGYITHAITDSGYMSAFFGFNRGFDTYVEKDIGEKNALTKTGARGTFEYAVAWIEENRSDKFFLFLHTYEIHAPFTHSEFLTKDEIEGFQNLDQAEKEKKLLNLRYDSGILHTDHYVGLLKDTLDRLNLTRKTILIIVSDHGEELYQRGLRQAHGHTLYNELIHVPILFHSPGLFPPQIVAQKPAHLVDIMPTVLDILGKDAGYSLQGVSLLPELKGQVLKKNRVLLSEALFFGLEKKAVYTQGEEFNKFIWGVEIVPYAVHPWNVKFRDEQRDVDYFSKVHLMTLQNRGIEFFQLDTDPGELVNVSDISRAEQQKLQNWLQNYIKAYPSQKGSGFEELSEELIEQLKSLGYM